MNESFVYLARNLKLPRVPDQNSFFAGLAAKRCESWENTERLQLALIWASYSFRCDLIPSILPYIPCFENPSFLILKLEIIPRPSQVEFCRASLQLSAESLSSLSLPSLLQYLLLVSYRADDRVGFDYFLLGLCTIFKRLTAKKVGPNFQCSSAVCNLNYTSGDCPRKL